MAITAPERDRAQKYYYGMLPTINPDGTPVFRIEAALALGEESVMTDAVEATPPVAVDIVPGLSLLVAGATAPHPQELLISKEFLTLAQTVQPNFGVVIYDTPSDLDSADACVVASRIGAAILVAAPDQGQGH
jgi:Mrp family chromosome partitioning ATPase